MYESSSLNWFTKETRYMTGKFTAHMTITTLPFNSTCRKAWWRHQMETFSASLAICAGNSPVSGEFPNKGQWRGALIFSLICAWINGWVNNREAGNLRRFRAHYDVSVMGKLNYLPTQLIHPGVCWGVSSNIVHLRPEVEKVYQSPSFDWWTNI